MPESFSFSGGTPSGSGGTSPGPRARELVKSQDFSTKPTKQLGDPDVAQQVRDVIKDIARQVVEEETSDSRVGRVISIDFAAKTANVWFAGDDAPVKVNLFSSTLPGSWQNQLPPGTTESNSLVGYGSIVMVETINGKPYITEVLTGGQFSIDWEAAGNIERVYDSSGNPSESGVASYTYKTEWNTNIAETGRTVSLLHDAFSRSQSGGWGKSDSGQQYFIDLGDVSNFSVAGGTGIHTLTQVDEPVQVIVPASGANNVISQWDVLAPPLATGAPIVAGHLIRHLNFANFYSFELRFNPNGTVTAAIAKMVNGAFADIGTFQLDGTYKEGERYRVKAECIENTLRMKAWKPVLTSGGNPGGDPGDGIGGGDGGELPETNSFYEDWCRLNQAWIEVPWLLYDYTVGWGTAPNGQSWVKFGNGNDTIRREHYTQSGYGAVLEVPNDESCTMLLDTGLSDFEIYFTSIGGPNNRLSGSGLNSENELRVITRAVDSGNYYAVVRTLTANYPGASTYTFKIIKVLGGSEILLVPPFTIHQFTFWRLRVLHKNDMFKVKIFEEGGPEPSNWTYELTDGSILSGTKIGFRLNPKEWAEPTNDFVVSPFYVYER